MKKFVNKALGKLGYKVVKTEKSNKKANRKFDDRINQAHAKLPEQIEEYKKIYDNPEYWSNPKRIKSYLNKGRIHNYFSHLDLAKEHGVGFDDRKIGDMGSYFPYLYHLMLQEYQPKEMHAYDYSDPALGFSKVIAPEVKTFTKDFFEVDEKYDVIFCTEVLEHMAHPDESLAHLYGLLNKGGNLILTVPNGRTDKLPAKKRVGNGNAFHGHVNLWTPEGWEIFVQRFTNPKAKVSAGQFDYGPLYAVVTRH